MNPLNWFRKKKESGAIEPVETRPKDDFKKVHLIEKNYMGSTNAKIPESDQFELEAIEIKEGDYFKANQTLFILGSKIHGSGLLYINLPFNGKMGKIFMDQKSRIKINDKLCLTSKIEDEPLFLKKLFEQNLSKLERTEVSYLEDDFTDDKTIKITKVSSEDTQYFKLYRDETTSAIEYLGLTFVNHNGNVYMSINSTNDDITLAKGDSIIMLFEDASKLNFTFTNVGEGTKGFRYNHVTIGFEELNTLLNVKLLKIKLISNKKNIYCVYHMNIRIKENYLGYEKGQYQTEMEGQYLLQYMTARFIEMNQEYKLSK